MSVAEDAVQLLAGLDKANRRWTLAPRTGAAKIRIVERMQTIARGHPVAVGDDLGVRIVEIGAA